MEQYHPKASTYSSPQYIIVMRSDDKKKLKFKLILLHHFSSNQNHFKITLEQQIPIIYNKKFYLKLSSPPFLSI